MSIKMLTFGSTSHDLGRARGSETSYYHESREGYNGWTYSIELADDRFIERVLFVRQQVNLLEDV